MYERWVKYEKYLRREVSVRPVLACRGFGRKSVPRAKVGAFAGACGGCVGECRETEADRRYVPVNIVCLDGVVDQLVERDEERVRCERQAEDGEHERGEDGGGDEVVVRVERRGHAKPRVEASCSGWLGRHQGLGWCVWVRKRGSCALAAARCGSLRRVTGGG